MRITHESFWKWKRLPTEKRLNPEFVGDALTRDERVRVLKKCLLGGLDPGRKATFTMMYFLVLELLEEENPKLASELAMSFRYGTHKNLKNQVPNYKLCVSLIKQAAAELTEKCMGRQQQQQPRQSPHPAEQARYEEAKRHLREELQKHLYDRRLEDILRDAAAAGSSKRVVGNVDCKQKFGAFWSAVKRARSGREKALLRDKIVDHFWQALLKIYRYFFLKYRQEEEAKRVAGREAYDLEKHAHNLTIMRIAEKAAKCAYEPLKSIDDELAQRHARLFSCEFINLLEELLLLWQKCAANKRYPYPSIKMVRRLASEEEKKVLSLTHSFFRRYCLFVVGDMGWSKKTASGGYEVVSAEKMFFSAMRQWGVIVLVVSERNTTAVKVYNDI